MTVTNREAEKFDEQIEKLKKQKERELLMKKFKDKGGQIKKLDPQKITLTMKRNAKI